MHFFWGFVGILISFLLVKYRRQISDFTGPIDFAERVLGRGSTPTALVLFAVFLFFLSISFATGHLDTFVRGTFGKLFGIS